MRILTAAILLVFSLHVAAGERKIALVQPKETSLVLAKMERRSDLFAEFKGGVKVSGTLVAEWVGGKGNLDYKEPDYSLVPDASSIGRLPHFSGYQVRFIELRNGLEALELAAGSAKTDLLMKRKIVQVKVTGSFVINEYVVGVECDASWAKASVISAEVPDIDFAAIVRPIETC